MTQLNTDMAAYYAAREDRDEEGYQRPEAAAGLATLRQQVADLLRGHRVLELAAGDGYWTEAIAPVAASLVATDINPTLLERIGADVQRIQADALALQVEGDFSACFAGFWWSHMTRDQQDALLDDLRRRIGKDGLLVLVDNNREEGVTPPIARTDLEGNTWEIRRLADGSRHEVPKNYPTDSALRKRVGPALRDIRIQRLDHYWMLTGRLR